MTKLIIVPLFIGTTELIVIGAVALLLFGGKKLPEMMRGMGKGVREFKEGMSEGTQAMREEMNKESEDQESEDNRVKESIK
jgi:sec-independent protein translocase protein TatA